MKKEKIIEYLEFTINRISKRTKDNWDAFYKTPDVFVKTLRLQGKSMDIQNIVEQAIASDEKCQYIRINAQDIADYVYGYNRDFDIIPTKEQLTHYLNHHANLCWQKSVLNHCPFITLDEYADMEEYKAYDKQLGYGIFLIENIEKVKVRPQDIMYYYNAINSIAKDRCLYNHNVAGAWKVILGFEGDYGDREGLNHTRSGYLPIDEYED